jgi:hypothetical protein
MTKEEAADLFRTIIKGLTAEQAVELMVRAMSDGTPAADRRPAEQDRVVPT